MTDFRQIIIKNLAYSPEIVESPEVIIEIDSLLHRVDQAGHQKLVDNFCNQTDPERARDFLLELWICDLLSCDSRVENLQYEPADESFPPDFRFMIDGCAFDLQVKRMHNVNNEIIRRRFRREIERRLSYIQKPWFIDYWLSEKLQPKHINAFFDSLNKNIDRKRLTHSSVKALMAEHYRWSQDGVLLVKYAFRLNNSGELGIQPGVYHGPCGCIDLEAIRKSVDNILKKSRKTLTHEVSTTQSNIVLIEAVGDVWLDKDTMETSLWGDRIVRLFALQDGSRKMVLTHAQNGLFRDGQFHRICGVIFIDRNANPIDEIFKGSYFAHPMHIHNIKKHPKPFSNMSFIIPKDW
ncbi:MAG: hypothetical protein ABFD46_02645 [Armatimonadota bacterium]